MAFNESHEPAFLGESSSVMSASGRFSTDENIFLSVSISADGNWCCLFLVRLSVCRDTESIFFYAFFCASRFREAHLSEEVLGGDISVTSLKWQKTSNYWSVIVEYQWKSRLPTRESVAVPATQEIRVGIPRNYVLRLGG